MGEIWDESDKAIMSICDVGNNTWQVSADTKPEDLFEAIGYEDKDFDSDYTTVGGWVLELLEHIPVEGETLHYKDLDMRILSVEDQRSRQIEVKKNVPADPGRRTKRTDDTNERAAPGKPRRGPLFAVTAPARRTISRRSRRRNNTSHPPSRARGTAASAGRRRCARRRIRPE